MNFSRFASLQQRSRLALVSSALLVPCWGALAQETAPDPAPAAVSDGAALFDAVSKQLDVGGEVFVYQNIAGEIEGFAKSINGFAKKLAEMAPEEDPMVSKLMAIDFAALVRDIGIAGVEAYGASSIKVGDGYRNKIYVHVPGGRRGLLRMLGREAAPFEGAILAPADADIVLERELNLTEIYRVGRDLVEQLKEPEAERGWKEMMARKVADLGFTVGDMLQKLDTRIILIARMSDTEKMEIPDAPFAPPKTEFYLSLDKMAWLADRLLAKLPPEAQEALQEGEGFKLLNFPPVPPEAPIMQPVLRVDTQTGRVAIASSAAFLDECLSGRGGLFASEKYKAAAAGLPTVGNGLAYISPDVGRHLEALMREAMQMAGGLEPDAVAMIADRIDELIPFLRGSYASVSTNLPDGVLSVSNAPVSWKQATLAVPAMFLPTMFFAKSSHSSERPELPEMIEFPDAVEPPDAVDAPEPIERP